MYRAYDVGKLASPALDWFHSYVSDHSQTFIAANSKSDPVPVECIVPQGSVLGPVQFIAYTDDVTELFHKHDLGYHLFADDKQVYTHVLPGEVEACLHKLASCISELEAWFASRRLQLNAAKTELIWFGSRAALQKPSADRSLAVDTVVIHPVDVVRDLGVLLDS